MKLLLCIFGVSTTLLLLFAHSAFSGNGSELTGDWVLPDGSAVVRIEFSEETGQYAGTVLALLRPSFSVIDGYGEPGRQRLDIRNRDETLKRRSVLGLEIASGLRFDGETWNGEIYDPGSGSSYRCRITLIDEDFVEVRGYIGFSLLGRTMHWQRLASFERMMSNMLDVGSRGSLGGP